MAGSGSGTRGRGWAGGRPLGTPRHPAWRRHRRAACPRRHPAGGARGFFDATGEPARGPGPPPADWSSPAGDEAAVVRIAARFGIDLLGPETRWGPVSDWRRQPWPVRSSISRRARGTRLIGVRPNPRSRSFRPMSRPLTILLAAILTAVVEVAALAVALVAVLSIAGSTVSPATTMACPGSTSSYWPGHLHRPVRAFRVGRGVRAAAPPAWALPGGGDRPRHRARRRPRRHGHERPERRRPDRPRHRDRHRRPRGAHLALVAIGPVDLGRSIGASLPDRWSLTRVSFRRVPPPHPFWGGQG